MAAFEYSALDAAGATCQGVLEADSDRQARRQLRQNGLTPLDVREPHKATKKARSSPRGRRLSGEQLALFTRLLGTLLQSGLPLDDALGILLGQADTPAVEKLVVAIRAKIREGHTLEAALDEHPRAFPDVYRATVGAGEQTRLLPLVLQQLAGHVERREEVVQKVRVAMIYPAVLTLTAVAVVTGLLTYVVPQVVRVFTDVGETLPFITQVLISFSDMLRDHGLVLAAGLACTIFALTRLYQRPGIRRGVHRILLATPLIGKFLLHYDTARFASTLGILLSSGVDMIDALLIASRSATLIPLRDSLQDVCARVREGEALSAALRAAGLTPLLLTQLIESGENSGELPTMLATAATAFDHKTERSIAVLLGLIEPLLIFAMGAVILFIVVAIMLPIFEMNQFV